MSSALNPYAGELGKAHPEEVLARTPELLRKLVDTLGAAGCERSYAPGKWSARQIFCHLADCEIAFSFRLRQTLAEANHVIQPFDQDAWSRTYAGMPAEEAVETLAALRRWNLTFFKAAGPGARTKPVTHPERGAMTFETIVQTMAGHDRHHLAQLKTIEQAR